MSGNLASGAREVGQAVAQELGIDFVDQQLMVEASQRCGVSVVTVAEHDERRGSFRERLSGLLRTVLERSAASGADPLTGGTGLEAILSRSYADMAAEEPQLSDSLYLQTMTTLIRELAARGEVVILGRGSQMLLADMPRALHVLCVAPRKLRANRLAERDEIGMEEAMRRTAESDRARCAFYKKFWHVEVEDPKLYDLTIDTARLSYDIATQVVVAAARAKTAEAQPV
jgi:cytidylate kinase